MSLRAALVTRQSGRREVLGMLSVVLPLDRVVSPARSSSSLELRSSSLKPASSFELPPRARVAKLEWHPSGALAGKTGRHAAQRSPEGSGGSDADPARDQGARPHGGEDQGVVTGAATGARAIVLSPGLSRAAVHAALRAHGFVAARRRLSSMSGRARVSATLPELRLRVARSNDESRRISPTSSDPYRYTQAGGSTLWFEARLTWKLDRLVFAGEELAIERLRQQRDKARRELVERVLVALFAWQRALVKSADSSLLPTERTLARLDALEARATLDVLTGGWFSRRLGTAR